MVKHTLFSVHTFYIHVHTHVQTHTHIHPHTNTHKHKANAASSWHLTEVHLLSHGVVMATGGLVCPLAACSESGCVCLSAEYIQHWIRTWRRCSLGGMTLDPSFCSLHRFSAGTHHLMRAFHPTSHTPVLTQRQQKCVFVLDRGRRGERGGHVWVMLG